MNKSENLFFGELLQQFRARKRLNQKQLAQQIGVSREAVSLWERGYYKPETDTILYELVRLLGLTEQEQRQLFEAYTVTALAVSFHNPPIARNPYFTGRRAQLTDLHKLLMAGKQVALTQAVSGLGGIGKTQLAMEYAYRYQKSYHDIFWAVADTYESLIASFIRLAALLHLPEYDEPDQSKVKAAVQHWLSKHAGWLLILDNIEDLSLLNQFVPVNRQGAVLLTTRREVTEPVAQAVALDIMLEGEGTLFLLKRAGYLPLGASLADSSAEDVIAVRTIVHLLGGLPLAIDQAGAYILETGCGLAAYLNLYKQRQAEMLGRRASLPTDHPHSVTATFTLAFEQVGQRNPAAIELLRLCAYLAPDAIGEEIITNGASHLGPVLQPVGSDPMTLNESIEVLRVFSLLRRHPASKTMSVHRLVQSVLRDGMGEQEREQWIGRTVEAVNAAFPEVAHEVWEQCERLTPHVLACTTHAAHQEHSQGLASLLSKTAIYLHQRGRYTEAEPLYQRAVHVWEQALGPDHPQVADPLNDLATLYREQGNFTEAESLFQRALRLREQALGPDHLDVTISLNGLATLYQEQGNFTEAEQFYQRTLRIREQALEPDHPSVAYPLTNLATIYRRQGKYEQAEQFYQRALRIREQALGPDHPDVAYPLHGLATIHREQGRYELAEPLYQRVLRLWEQALGPDHPDLAYPLANLAALYHEQGKYEQAEQFYQRALRIREQAWGPDHPSVAYTLPNLAALYCEQGKYEQAEALYQRALHIWEQTLGSDHPDVAYLFNGMANLYREQRRYAQAEPLYQRALTIRQYHRGQQHPETAESLYDLAIFHHRQQNTAKALSLYQQALAIQEQQLGRQHPSTIKTRMHYAQLLQESGRQEEAAALETKLAYRDTAGDE